jgi:glycosyltransferase involved in cell wall biosynthesis
MNDLVSVLIPAWNRESYIGEAIGSVLSQAYQPLEIIVVDDGSTDSTAAVASAFGSPVRVVYQEHGGIGSARNRALHEATGHLIAWLDSDDRWTPGSLQVRIDALLGNESIAMVFGHLVEFHDPPDPRDGSLRPYPGWSASSFLSTRRVVDKMGLFETDLRLGEFVSWCTRARERGFRSMLLPETVGERRIHATNTVSEDRDRSDYVRVVADAIARRRSRESR